MNGAAGAARDIDGQTEKSNGDFGKSDIEGKAALVAASELGSEQVSNGREHMSQRGQRASFNGARGTRDIEGKVTRVGASERGQRASFNSETNSLTESIRLRIPKVASQAEARENGTHLIGLRTPKAEC